ncbi:MAG: class I SAM-dependent methyltransferase [Acidobacteriota bacterium]
MPSPWPQGFPRIPDEDWCHRPIETLARKYDTVEHHGWYRNLEPTVAQLCSYLRDDHLLLDYSGGTGILTERLIAGCPDRHFGILIVDSSPKFLRLALEKFEQEERVAFRLIRYLKDEKRLQLVDEVLERPLRERGVDALASTNAIHLYYDLEETLRSWAHVLRPGGCAFVQSGNIRNPAAAPSEWIIDETVEAVHQRAMMIVGQQPRYALYRELLDDTERMREYDRLRRKFFLPVRPLDHYNRAFRDAGFRIVGVDYHPIEARVDEWRAFLATYHEGILGWVGGSQKIEGHPPTEAALRHRLELLEAAMSQLFPHRSTFQAGWTYITAQRKEM